MNIGDISTIAGCCDTSSVGAKFGPMFPVGKGPDFLGGGGGIGGFP